MTKVDNFDADSEKSAKILETIKPVLEQHFGGIVCPIERQDNDACDLLDKRGGIDALVSTDTAFFGIAHRVKYNYYTDFTIRKYRPNSKTEIDHMRQDGIKPRYHVQTVCVDDKPTVIAIARSMDLRRAIDSGLATTNTAHNSGCEFFALDWNRLIENGINVDIIKL